MSSAPSIEYGLLGSVPEIVQLPGQRAELSFRHPRASTVESDLVLHRICVDELG